MEMMKYEVGKLLGSGSFGKVYLALRKADDLRCVLKIVNLRDLPIEARLLALNEVHLQEIVNVDMLI
jgi:serine/threonine protein kinase